MFGRKKRLVMFKYDFGRTKTSCS